MISFLSNGTVSGTENVCVCEDCNEVYLCRWKNEKTNFSEESGWWYRS